ncbi:MAG: glycosyltransferase family 4 protein [Draconibacterium sp.]
MRITWVTRSFLDYRIPVYDHINRLSNNRLTVIYYEDVVPARCQEKLKSILGDRAIGLSGEIRLGGQKEQNQAFANTGGLRIPIRPGLVRKVRKTHPEIILSDGFFQWTYAALLNRAFWRTPHLMCYERTHHTERNVTGIRSKARKMAAKYIDAVCCNGIQTREYLHDFGFPKEKLFTGNMAADSDGLAHAVSQLSEKEIESLKIKYDLHGRIFLYVGQLIPRKGIMELLQAWKKFEKSTPGQTLVLLGGGEQLEEVKTWISQKQVKTIKLPGKVDYSEVAHFYAAGDIFIMPTLEDNWSLVVPEAMSCRLPIICSKYNGCWPELVKPENGWVFDPLNPQNFADAFQLAWENREKWPVMGEESLNIAKEYSPQKIAEQIFTACRETLSNKKL